MRSQDLAVEEGIVVPKPEMKARFRAKLDEEEKEAD